MNQLKKGEYFGSHYQKSVFENIIVTDTEYTHPNLIGITIKIRILRFCCKGSCLRLIKKKVII